MRIIFAIACLTFGLVAHAANPAFSDFNTNQFSTTGNRVAIKTDALYPGSPPIYGGIGTTNIYTTNDFADSFTYSVSTSQQISGAVSNLWTDTNRFKYYGGNMSQAGASGVFTNFGSPNGIDPTIYLTNYFAPFITEFLFDGDEFSFSTIARGQTVSLWVDGLHAYAGMNTLANTTNVNYVAFRFPSKATRKILIVQDSSALSGSIGSVAYNPTNAILYSTTRTTRRIIVQSDSFLQDYLGYGALNWMMLESPNLDVWGDSVGGSGYYNPDTTNNFRARFTNDVLRFNPEYFVISGGYNDSNVSNTNTLYTNALAYYQTVKAALPNTKVLVIGPMSSSGTPTAALTNVDYVYGVAASVVGYRYVSPILEQWITGTNTVPGSGNAVVYITAGDVHPNYAGRRYYGLKILSMLQKFYPEIEDSPGTGIATATVATLPSSPTASTNIYCSDVLTLEGTGGIVSWDGSVWRNENGIQATADTSLFLVYGRNAGLTVIGKKSEFYLPVRATATTGIDRQYAASGTGATSGTLVTDNTVGTVTSFVTGTTGAGLARCDYRSPLRVLETSSIYMGGGKYSVNILSTPTNTYWLVCGGVIFDNGIVKPSSGAYFMYDHENVTGHNTAFTNNWIAVCVRASSYSFADTGLPVALGPLITDANLTATVSTNAAKFYTNGVLACTISTNIPNTAFLYPMRNLIIQTNGVAGATLYEQFPSFGARYGTARTW